MTPTPPERVVQRIKSRVHVNSDGCWVWPGAVSVGYGRISWQESGEQFWKGVHQVMYAATHGPIPDGLDVDHLCHDPDECRPEVATDCPHRRCCNPDHLAAVTRQRNLLRGGTVAAERAARTHCPHGHEYTAENTFRDKLNRRYCRACGNAYSREYATLHREEKAAYNREYYWRKKAEAQNSGASEHPQLS